MSEETILTAQNDTDAAEESSAQPVEGAAAPEEAAGAGEAPAETGTESEKAPEGNPLHGAPEAYADFAFPDGVAVDPSQLEAFAAFARELGLSQEGAQKVIDFEVTRHQRMAEGLITAHRQQMETWIGEIKGDKEIGGAKFQEAAAIARSALERFGGDELRAILNPYDPDTNPQGLGLGNHPAIVRAFHRIGKAISNDQPPAGNTPTGKSALQKLYPTMNQ